MLSYNIASRIDFFNNIYLSFKILRTGEKVKAETK